MVEARRLFSGLCFCFILLFILLSCGCYAGAGGVNARLMKDKRRKQRHRKRKRETEKERNAASVHSTNTHREVHTHTEKTLFYSVCVCVCVRMWHCNNETQRLIGEDPGDAGRPQQQSCISTCGDFKLHSFTQQPQCRLPLIFATLRINSSQRTLSENDGKAWLWTKLLLAWPRALPHLVLLWKSNLSWPWWLQNPHTHRVIEPHPEPSLWNRRYFKPPISWLTWD